MGKIPKIDSIEELARFWDTHDITDFEAELEEVGEPVFGRRGEGVVRIRLDPERARGMDESELVEEWVNERLKVS
jgi:hypothetical protein